MVTITLCALVVYTTEGAFVNSVEGQNRTIPYKYLNNRKHAYMPKQPPDPAQHILAAGETTDACQEPPPPELLHGIEQFNHREYFECHETLENIWNREARPIRTLYKGILQ